MAWPAEASPPIVRGDDALRDIACAVEWIRGRRHVERVNLIGWSWGTVLTGAYASQHPHLVARLVLYAPLWLRLPDESTAAMLSAAPLPAYRTVSRRDALQRWLAGVPENAKSNLIPAGWLEQWLDATWSTDTEAGADLLRAPNGVMQDVREYFYAGRPYYDPTRIIAPTLVVTAEWDNDTPPYMAKALFYRLPPSATNSYVELNEGTHSIIMERNRLSLFSAVQDFLNRPIPS